MIHPSMLSEQLFEGTAAFLKFVRESGGQYAFLTNNSSRGIEGYLAKMERMGIPQKPEYFPVYYILYYKKYALIY